MDFKTNAGGVGSIELRDDSDAWGPFEMDFVNGIPSGQTVVAVTLSAYAEKVTKKDDLTGKSNIKDLILEPDSEITNGTKYSFKLQHPGDSYRGIKATLIFMITTNTGGKFPFFFYPVKVY